MKIISNFSDNEKNLLFLLFTLLILFSSYQFGYVPLTNKADHLYEQNKELTSTLNELQMKKDNQEKYISETNSFQERTNEMLEEFPIQITQEKNIIFVTQLEEYAKMKVASITFQDITKFYESNQNNEDTVSTGENVNTDEGEQSEASSEELSDKEINNNSDFNTKEANKKIEGFNTNNIDMKGYTTSMVINYQCNYKGLKKMIEFINTNEEKMNISDLSAAFDYTTGNLTGSVTISVYALNGIDKAEEELLIPNIEIGTNNIFGSFELPVSGSK